MSREYDLNKIEQPKLELQKSEEKKTGNEALDLVEKELSA